MTQTLDSKIRQQKVSAKELFVSCIVPVHNEGEGIKKFIEQLTTTLNETSNQFEIVVVDDGSKDDTPQILNELAQKSLIKVIRLSRNFGKETALTAGLEQCHGEVAILIDGDFQHPLDMIPKFIKEWSLGHDMVYGVRQNRDNEPYLKRAFTHWFYTIMRHLTQIELIPNAGDFRLLDRQVINALANCHERSRFMKGLYAWVGFSTKGLPFKVASRQTGTSSWRFKSLAELAITGFTSFSNIPLRIWSLVGFFISLIAFSYAVFITARTLIYGTDLPGYASIMVAIMFFGGIQLLSIGILGEYIARIFNEVKNRPKYIIQQKIGFD